MLTFDYMDVEPSFRCMADYVVVHGPWNETLASPPPTPICGSSLPAPIVEDGGHLYVVFVSNAALVFTGFSARYEMTPPPCELIARACFQFRFLPFGSRWDNLPGRERDRGPIHAGPISYNRLFTRT